jgi:alpha-1,3-rhamnosyltransferase
MKFPLVSVAIPAYNHAHFIEACLASVCSQTYPELELILIDDGSTDNTFETAKRYLEPYHDRFRRIVLERRENQGVSANSNACIQACQGAWVHLLGSDDVLYPNKIERIQQAIKDWNCSDLALVHAEVDYIDEQGHLVWSKAKHRRLVEAEIERNAFCWLFFGTRSIINPTVALRRDAFLAIGGFDRNLALEDLDCWLRLSVNHSFGHLPEALACYRRHPNNTLRKRVKMLGAQFQTFAKFLTINPGLISEAEIRRHFRRNLWRFWRRIRNHNPLLFPKVLFSISLTYFCTPKPDDYQRIAVILNHAPN